MAVDGLEARSLPGRVFHSTFIIGGGGANGGSFDAPSAPAPAVPAAEAAGPGIDAAVRVAGGGGREASLCADDVSPDVHEAVYDLLVFGGQQLGLTNGR